LTIRISKDAVEDLASATRPQAHSAFPVRSLGPMKGSLDREEIYGDLV
jgi:hypothetical protein